MYTGFTMKETKNIKGTETMTDKKTIALYLHNERILFSDEMDAHEYGERNSLNASDWRIVDLTKPHIIVHGVEYTANQLARS